MCKHMTRVIHIFLWHLTVVAFSPTLSTLSVLRGRCRFRTTAWPVSWSTSVGRSIGWRWSKCATAIRRCWTTPRTSWRSVARSQTCCVTSLWRLPLLCPPRSNTWALLRWISTPDASHCVKTSYWWCRPLVLVGQGYFLHERYFGERVMAASYSCNHDVHLGLTCKRKPQLADLYEHIPLISTYLPGWGSLGCFNVDCSWHLEAGLKDKGRNREDIM